MNSKKHVRTSLGRPATFTFLARSSPGVLPAENRRARRGRRRFLRQRRTLERPEQLPAERRGQQRQRDRLPEPDRFRGRPVGGSDRRNARLTNGYNAEYGRGAGGVVNVNLKSRHQRNSRQRCSRSSRTTSSNANRWENNGPATSAARSGRTSSALPSAARSSRTDYSWFGDYQGTRIASTGGAVQNLGIWRLLSRSRRRQW